MAPNPPPGYSRILDENGNRLPLKAVYGDFDGATFGRRFGNWGTSISGPNTTIYNSLTTLRSRSRELVRNNSIPSGGLDAFVANLIRTGISPRWQREDRALKKEVQQLWVDWCQEAHTDGTSDCHRLEAFHCPREVLPMIFRFRNGIVTIQPLTAAICASVPEAS